LLSTVTRENTLRTFFRESDIAVLCGSMVTVTVPVEIPAEILELAERSGISRERMSALLRSFAVLEVLASSSKLSMKDAEKLSSEIKISAWKRLSQYKR
jgi:hypothetical protein